ncbi:Oxidase ustYa [Pseudocercospora fuligena]|uniref:Oxidase ustYa n=1 Tax=Pseudocercospora fuligena TaxID=685502 RepID=A0A8H6RQ22_9PEZI|nr:Oxidase ustYa [Pseudocercospora fuligena]
MSGVDRSLQDYRFMPFNLTPGRCSASALEAGDDVDDAWKDLGVYYNVAILPEEYAPAYGVSRSQHHHLTPDTDPDVPYAGFPVNIQVFHQLHCLNMLRQGLYHNADFYRKDPSNIAWSGDQDEVLQAHLAHCVDDLRQLIMCFADNDVVPYLKPEGNIQPMPEFSRWKKCRNFESLRQWGEKNHWQAGFNATPIHKHTP